MWIIRTFKTRKNMNAFIAKNEGKIQWTEIFINNGYGIEYRRLRKVY